MTSCNDSAISAQLPLSTPNPCVPKGREWWGSLESYRGDELDQPDELMRRIRELEERLSRLSEAGLRISESLDFDTVLQEAVDAGRVLTYERLMRRVWGEQSAGDVRPMRTIVGKLRRKQSLCLLGAIHPKETEPTTMRSGPVLTFPAQQERTGRGYAPGRLLRT